MRLPLLASILVLLSTPAWAQEASCISTPTQLVASMPNDDVGDSFAIYHKSNPTQVIPCRFDRDAADLVIEGWYALEALMGDYLVLSEGSSAVRSLVLFELKKGKSLVEAEGEYEALTPVEFIFWERREDGTPDNCPQYEEYKGYGGGAVISHQLTYRFDTRKIAPTGETRCDYLE